MFCNIAAKRSWEACLVPMPLTRGRWVSGHVDRTWSHGCLSRIRQQNALTEKAWEEPNRDQSMKSYVARFTTHVQTYVQTVLQQIIFASCGILTSDWLKLRGSHGIHGIYVTCCKTSLPRAGKTGNISCTDFVPKIRTTFYFLQQLFVTCNNLICCKTVWLVGGKTRNIAIHLVLQQCCKASCVFCPF